MISKKIFSGGEIHIQDADAPIYKFDLWSSDDIMEMLLLLEEKIIFKLIIPYVPYARQDRVNNPGEVLGIKVMAKLINSLKPIRVEIWDPHSDVTPALINNCSVISQAELACSIPQLVNTKYAGVIAPDAGATKKAFELAKRLHVPLYQALKHRDTSTGLISHTSIDDLDPGHYLVADDICDGGATFIALAKVLPSDCTADLYVTHGIFAYGVDTLLCHYKRVFTVNQHPAVVNTSPSFIPARTFINETSSRTSVH